MKSTDRPARTRALAAPLAAALLALGLTAPPAAAQQALSTTPFFVVDWGNDDVLLTLAGVSIHPHADGLTWTASAQVYRVRYPAGTPGTTDETDASWAFSPSAGLRYGWDGGSVQGRVGYSFQSGEDDMLVEVPFFGGGGGGVTSSAHLDLRPLGPANVSAIGSYNWGSEYLWSRLRTMFPIGTAERFRLGGEVLLQGRVFEDQDADGYRSVQVGPVAQVATERATFGVALGYREDNRNDDDNFYHVKFELVLH